MVPIAPIHHVRSPSRISHVYPTAPPSPSRTVLGDTATRTPALVEPGVSRMSNVVVWPASTVSRPAYGRYPVAVAVT